MSKASAITLQPAFTISGRTILKAGLLAGAMDISAAFIQAAALRGIGPVRVLRYVASGLLGAASFEGGAATAALGLLLHFFIATSAAAVFHVASRMIAVLIRHPWISGIFYGIAVYGFMNLVVLPLSAIPRKPTYPADVVISGILIHIVCIGLPIALINARAAKQQQPNVP